MLCAYDAGVVSRSPKSLAKMITVIVTLCALLAVWSYSGGEDGHHAHASTGS